MTSMYSRNVLITSSNFPRGSASANYLNLFCRGVALSGSYIEVYILKGYFLGGRKTDDSRVNVTDYGVKYTFLSFVNRSSKKLIKIISDIYSFFSLTWLLFSFLNKRKSIIVFAYNNELYHSFLITCFCKLARIKIITFVPEYYDISEFSGGLAKKMRWYGFLLNFNYFNRLSYKLIVFSHYIKAKYIEKNYPENRILVQPNLTDFDFWKSNDNENVYTLGYCGTLYKKDGIEDLLYAISLLRKRKVEVTAIIVGDVVNEKSIIPSLSNFCKNHGIDNAVTFTGLVTHEEVKKILNKCMILAITRPDIVQTVAGFPTKIGEYFACNKIVMSTKIGDVWSYFQDRKEIVFSEPSNPQSIAENLEWILNNRGLSNQIAEDGYLKADSLLNFKKIVPLMMEFIHRVE
jgi:glycosyltransferase involved in cell wall biosynthesis